VTCPIAIPDDLDLTGSTVQAQNGATLLAGNNITIQSAANTREETHTASSSGSGFGLSGY
jgi:hypothetical protein